MNSSAYRAASIYSQINLVTKRSALYASFNTPMQFQMVSSIINTKVYKNERIKGFQKEKNNKIHSWHIKMDRKFHSRASGCPKHIRENWSLHPSHPRPRIFQKLKHLQCKKFFTLRIEGFVNCMCLKPVIA